MQVKWAVALASCVVLALAGCSGDDDGGGTDDASDTTEAADDAGATTTAAVETLTILVTNDDGIEGQGMADLVDGLQELPNTEVTVVVPDADQTGQGGQTTPGGVTGAEATTVNGDDAIAVSGFPADSVIHGLDEVFADEPPDLVVSGINAGQNIGPVIEVSGTVSAARQAAALGVPALAVSQGGVALDEYDYTRAVDEAVAWVEEHRDAVLADDTAAGEQTEAQSINVPTCPEGEPKDLVEVPVAQEGEVETADAVAESDCTSTLEDPANDVEGLNNGFIVLSVLPPGLGNQG